MNVGYEGDRVVDPEDVWDPWSRTIDSWSEAVDTIDTVSENASSKDLVWRGAADASWALHGSLFRRLFASTGRLPSEADMQARERDILRRCRAEWRFDNLSTLELFAHLQHYGGPTRLLDVTLNPLIALWFAVEQRYDKTGSLVDDIDGRLFAFCVAKRIDLVESWESKGLPWNGWDGADEWGTGRLHFWLPPAYNERISAQNAGFLVDGVPVTRGGGNVWAKKPASPERWSIDEVRTAMSVPARAAKVDRKVALNSFPTFNFRVTAGAKARIRQNLESRYGYSTASIYPDLPGLSLHVAPDLPA